MAAAYQNTIGMRYPERSAQSRNIGSGAPGLGTGIRQQHQVHACKEHVKSMSWEMSFDTVT